MHFASIILKYVLLSEVQRLQYFCS